MTVFSGEEVIKTFLAEFDECLSVGDEEEEVSAGIDRLVENQILTESGIRFSLRPTSPGLSAFSMAAPGGDGKRSAVRL